MGKKAFFLAAALGVIFSAAARSYEKPEFPRLGGYNIGSPQNYNDPEYQRQLGRLDVVIINTFPGWETAKGMSVQEAVQGIKAHNPRALVFQYVNVNERNAKHTRHGRRLSTS